MPENRAKEYRNKERQPKQFREEGFTWSNIEAKIAQEAYLPLKIADEIIGILNTSGIHESGVAMKNGKLITPGSVWSRRIPKNPFEDDKLVTALKAKVFNFSQLTGSSEEAVYQIFDMMDNDIAKGRQLEASKKIVDLSLFFMDQVRASLKHKYPW